MAYMNQDKKKQINEEIKKAIKEMGITLKYSLKVENYSTIIMTIKKCSVDLVNSYFTRSIRNGNVVETLQASSGTQRLSDRGFTGEAKDVVNKILECLNLNNFNKSDSMTDYFHVGHYAYFSLHADFEVVDAPKSKKKKVVEVVEVAEPIVEIVEEIETVEEVKVAEVDTVTVGEVAKENSNGAVFKQITERTTQDEMKEIVSHDGVIVVRGESLCGNYEIYDRRGLIETINNPIKGNGVERYLGSTHFIVTSEKLEALQADGVEIVEPFAQTIEVIDNGTQGEDTAVADGSVEVRSVYRTGIFINTESGGSREVTVGDIIKGHCGDNPDFSSKVTFMRVGDETIYLLEFNKNRMLKISRSKPHMLNGAVVVNQ